MSNTVKKIDPRTARIEQLETALKKESLRLELKTKEYHLHMNQTKPRFPDTHEIRERDKKLALRQMGILVKHINNELYQVRVFPIMEGGKVTKLD